MPTIRINEQVTTGQTPHALGLNLSWTAAEQKLVKNILSKYPEDRSRSATIPLLHLAQRKCEGWLPVDAMQLVADTLQLPYIRVYEVASFYTMFNLKPVGKYHLQVCTNCSCLIRGSDAVLDTIKQELNITNGQTTEDKMFTLTEVECLGACVAAPMMQVGSGSYFSNLNAKKTTALIHHLKSGRPVDEFIDTPPAAVDPLTLAGTNNVTPPNPPKRK
jgi:NADH-quinone oxidoreductase E subunit